MKMIEHAGGRAHVLCYDGVEIVLDDGALSAFIDDMEARRDGHAAHDEEGRAWCDAQITRAGAYRPDKCEFLSFLLRRAGFQSAAGYRHFDFSDEA